MDINKKLELIKRNTAEIVTEEELINLLKTKKQINAYYGIAPTGPFHMGYLIPLSKIFDLEKVNIKTKILIADLHSALDDLKTPWDQIKKRAEYYKKCIELSFPWNKKPEFILGSSFQLKEDYCLDVLKMSTSVTVKRATRAASEVCRLKNPKVSEMIYPIMQALDEQYLNVDMQIGGIDQRHICMLAREELPKLNYKPRVELFTPLVVSLKGPGAKMSASVPSSNIKVYDSEQEIKEKINHAYCLEGETEGNPILQLCQFCIFPVKSKIKIERPAKFGGDITYNNYKELENDFTSKKLHPTDLKQAVAKELTNIFEKARRYFEKNKDIPKSLGEEF